MEVRIPKEIKIVIAPELLKLNEIQERLDVKPSISKITWTDQYGCEKKLTKLSDSHIGNLANWLRERSLNRTERIIQGELEKRCSGVYPAWFNKEAEEYKNCQEIWRLKVY